MHSAQRTLVKSPPELWSELSDPDGLARRLGTFGEIRITRLEPEATVAWEGDGARGTVRLEPAGWGTRVTLTAELDERDAPAEAAEAAEAERAAAAGQPAEAEPLAGSGAPTEAKPLAAAAAARTGEAGQSGPAEPLAGADGPTDADPLPVAGPQTRAESPPTPGEPLAGSGQPAEADPLANSPENPDAARPIVILRIGTDDGVEGIAVTFYGGAMTRSLKAAVDDLGALAIGEDPLPFEAGVVDTGGPDVPVGVDVIIPMDDGMVPEVGPVLLEDVDEAARQRPHLWRHREAQAHGMAGCGVGVLPHDEHPDRAERLGEGAQHVLARWQVAAARGEFGAQEVPHGGDPPRDRLQCLRPLRIDDLPQFASRHGQHPSPAALP